MRLKSFLSNENKMGFITDKELPKLIHCIEKITQNKIKFLYIRNGVVFDEEQNEWRLNDLMWKCRHEV